MLELAPRGALNLHGSLLPRYRGRAPVNWVLVEGQTETGVSLHYMVAKPDAGDLVDQERVAIDPADTAFTLYGKLEEAAAAAARPRPAGAGGGHGAAGRRSTSRRAPTAAAASRRTAASTGAGPRAGSMTWCAASPIRTPGPSPPSRAAGSWSGGPSRWMALQPPRPAP